MSASDARFEEIVMQRNANLAKGRDEGNAAYKKERDALEAMLTQLIKDYMDHHSDRKVGNDELFKLAKKSNYVGEGKYTEKTLERQVAVIAARIRKSKKEVSGQ